VVNAYHHHIINLALSGAIRRAGRAQPPGLAFDPLSICLNSWEMEKLRLQDTTFHRIQALEVYICLKSSHAKPYIHSPHSTFLPQGIKRLVYATHISRSLHEVIVGQILLAKN